jgi:tetrahydromethanopterin S-methyltransferase subunit D
MALVVAGTLILLATAVVAAWNPGDELASWILIGAYVFVSLLMLVWAFLYTRQFGTSGIYRPVTVDPATEMREAVPVVERESAATPEDVSPERISQGDARC